MQIEHSQGENLDPEAQQRRETFALFGLAMYHAQCVEKSLAILVSAVFNKEFLPGCSVQREEAFENSFTKTTGHLLKRLRKQIIIPPNLDKNLDEVHQKRNWLAHDYFWERAGELQTTAGREKMMAELIVLSDFLLKVDAHLTDIYEKWCKRAGVSEEVIAQALEQLIKQKS